MLIFITSFLFASSVFSWKWEYTFVSGQMNTENQMISSPSHPSIRTETSYVTLSPNNVIFFGGEKTFEVDEELFSDFYNDVWHFNMYAWTRKKANGSDPLGPNIRRSSTSWRANDDTALFFGGFYQVEYESFYYNSMWQYSAAANTWTLLKGSDSTLNAPITWDGQFNLFDNSYLPDARSESFSWDGPANEFLLFGGESEGTAMYTISFNDLWVYTSVSDRWKMMKCKTNRINERGVVNEVGKFHIDNIPTSRMQGVFWKSSPSSYLLFGGMGNVFDLSTNTSSFYTFSDVWMYNYTCNMWKLISGMNPDDTNTTSVPDVYGVLNVYNSANHPSSRYGSSFFKLSSNEFLLMGGVGGGTNLENDIWVYNLNLNEWKWIGGSNEEPVLQYGWGCCHTCGPDGVSGGVALLKSQTEYLFLFGSRDAMSINEVWRYVYYDDAICYTGLIITLVFTVLFVLCVIAVFVTIVIVIFIVLKRGTIRVMTNKQYSMIATNDPEEVLKKEKEITKLRQKLTKVEKENKKMRNTIRASMANSDYLLKVVNNHVEFNEAELKEVDTI